MLNPVEIRNKGSLQSATKVPHSLDARKRAPGRAPRGKDMAWLFNSVLGICGVLVLVVLQNTVADANVFNVTGKVQDFIRKLERQHKTKVSWWDMYGKTKWLVDRANQYKKYHVTAKADPMRLGPAPGSKRTKSQIVHRQEFHNYQPLHEQKVSIKRTTRREKEVSWFTTKSIHIDVDVRASLSLFGIFNLAGNLDYRYDLRSGERHVEKEVVEFGIEKTITVPPLTKVEVEWVITESIEKHPWKADVVLDGWFTLWFEKPVQRHHLWFHPIDAVRDPDLKLHDPSGVVYTTEGFTEGVTTIGNYVRVKQHSIVGPQNETIRSPIHGAAERE